MDTPTSEMGAELVTLNTRSWIYVW